MNASSKSAAAPAFTLIETLVYMALFVIVVGCATRAVYDSWDTTRALRRNADDVARALEIGERWRADVRAARGTVQLTTAAGALQCRIPAPPGDVVYTFANGEIRRQSGGTGPGTLWLANVESSQMQSESRGPVAAWRWELELKSGRKSAQMRPLFTFECAASAATMP